MADARDEARLWYRDPTGDGAAARVDRTVRKARRGGKRATPEPPRGEQKR